MSRVADDEPERLNARVEGREGVAEGCAVALCRRFACGDQVPRKHLRTSHAISVSQDENKAETARHDAGRRPSNPEDW